MRKFAPETKGQYTIHKFILQTTDGRSLYISSFKPLEVAVGADVTLPATKFNETSYTLAGAITTATTQVSQATEEFNKPKEVAPVARRRKVSTTTAETLVGEAMAAMATKTVHAIVDAIPVSVPVTGREVYRGEAEQGAYINLQSAVRVLEQLNLKGTVSDLVAVADLIGRTQTAIFMDAQKDKRMESFRK